MENANQPEVISLKKIVLTLAVTSVGINIIKLTKTFSWHLGTFSREANKTEMSDMNAANPPNKPVPTVPAKISL